MTDLMNSQETDYQARRIPLVFTGNAKEYFNIWIINILFTIVTLGVYYAWAKVRNHRYFYNHTYVDNSSFDYLANPKTLLKGWAIAVAVFLIYNLLNAYLPIATIPFAILFMFLLPWVVLKSLMFRAKNTAFRSIRFQFDKPYGEAWLAYVGIAILIPFTLGMIIPYMIYRQKQFYVDGHRYGTALFRYTGQSNRFYGVYLKTSLFAILIGSMIAMLMALASSSMFFDPNAMTSPSMINNAEPSPGLPPLMFSALFASIILFNLFLVSYLQAHIFNIVMNHAQLENMHFESTMNPWTMVWIYISNTFAIVVSLGLLVPWSRIRLARYRASCVTLIANSELDEFVAKQVKEQNALGEELGEIFDLDIGL